MYKTLKATKDAYITNRVIKGQRVYNTNTGKAGTIDIFKLYGATRSGSVDNYELSRGLLQFDYSNLRSDFNAGKININSSTFKCTLRLQDVNGGQTYPANFKLVLHPLSKSFDEGTGRDIVFYQDQDVCNFLTASQNSVWNISGAAGVGTLGATNIDIISSGNLNDGAGVQALWLTQSFPLGTEDLEIDVTKIVSGTIAGLIPDCGFRLAFVSEQEEDQKTRFVKRFASSNAYDRELRPAIIVRYDDSITNNIGNFVFNNTGSIFFYNKIRGTLQNINSGSTTLTGSNCILLNVKLTVSGVGTYSQSVFGSQYSIGNRPVSGTYYASLSIPSNNSVIRSALNISASAPIKLNQFWTSVDSTLAFYSGTVEVSLPDADNEDYGPTKYNVTVTNLFSNYVVTDKARVRVFIFDANIPYSKVLRSFLESKCSFPENVHYSVRNSITEQVIIPYDTTNNSTKLSSDANSLYFDLDMSNFYEGNLYEIDIMIVENGISTYYRNVSAPFKIDQVA